MKQLSLFLLLLTQTVVFSQLKNPSGKYIFTFNGSNGFYEETLILEPNGRFNFHVFKDLDGNIPPESHSYGQGTWKLKKNIVYFTTPKSDLNSKFTLNLSKSQARFHTKSPRDISNRDIPTTLTIFKSEIDWLKGRKFKKH